MPVGAILVFDDYGFYGCEGVTTFCNELKTCSDLIFTHNLNGHAVFVKIASAQALDLAEQIGRWGASYPQI